MQQSNQDINRHDDPVCITCACGQKYIQQYVVLTYVLPYVEGMHEKYKGIQEKFIKIRGSYQTIDECQNRINELKQYDNVSDYFVIDVGKWSIIRINYDDAEKVITDNKKVNDILQYYKNTQEGKEQARKDLNQKLESFYKDRMDSVKDEEFKKRLESAKQLNEELQKQSKSDPELFEKYKDVIQNKEFENYKESLTPQNEEMEIQMTK